MNRRLAAFLVAATALVVPAMAGCGEGGREVVEEVPADAPPYVEDTPETIDMDRF